MLNFLLKATAITKRFPGVLALDQVSVAVERGEVHALLGENGAGKSTLLKILSGAHHQDSGSIEFAGKTLEKQSPADRQRLGIVTVYQELNLMPNLSVAENIFLGREPGKANFVDWTLMFRASKRITQYLDFPVDPHTLVSQLSVAEQQLVEIARALTFNAKLIILDEPTASLSEREVTKLHGIIRDLRSKGISIIYVTHRLNEVWSICNRYTVLRDGKPTGTGDVAATTTDQIIRMMVGRSVEYLRQSDGKYQEGQVILQIRALTRRKRSGATPGVPLQKIDLDIRKGEILGLAGLVGAGRTELVRLIFGAERFQSGQIMLHGKPVSIKSPIDAIKKGIVLVPEDRKQHGLFLTQSIRQNLTLPSLKRLCAFGFVLSLRHENKLIAKFRTALRIKMRNEDSIVGSLSGGNQQKVILARCIALEPEVLIVDEPTRGIDVGAKAEVHQILRQLADSGTAVVVVSSELPEVLSLCDRIVTIKEGRITGQMLAGEADEEKLMTLMALGSSESHAYSTTQLKLGPPI
jgi:inositol transport system ATP-binding protein